MVTPSALAGLPSRLCQTHLDEWTEQPLPWDVRTKNLTIQVVSEDPLEAESCHDQSLLVKTPCTREGLSETGWKLTGPDRTSELCDYVQQIRVLSGPLTLTCEMLFP